MMITRVYENPHCDAAGTSVCIGTQVQPYPLSEGNAMLCIRHFHTERLAMIQAGVKPAEWSRVSPAAARLRRRGRSS